MIQKSSYRQKPNNECYICQSEASFRWFKQGHGLEEKEVEALWESIGAKVCSKELDWVIPLNEPTEFLAEGDETILEKLANRILGIIRFETATKHKEGYKTQFHPSVFKDAR